MDGAAFIIFSAVHGGGMERCMILLTKLRGGTFALNSDLIETISENPDTTITLVNGNLHIVRESMQEVIDRTVEYRRRIFCAIEQQ